MFGMDKTRSVGLIIASAAGVLLGATGLYQALVPSGISGILDACTDFVSAPTAALILLAARGARGLLYCVARSSGLLIVVAVAALAYGFIRKNG